MLRTMPELKENLGNVNVLQGGFKKRGFDIEPPKAALRQYI